MQSTRRVHPALALAVTIACPLVSAVTLAAIAVGFAAVFGAPHDIVIGVVVAAVVFVVNAIALCLAFAGGEIDARVVDAPVSDTDIGRASYARAS